MGLFPEKVVSQVAVFADRFNSRSNPLLYKVDLTQNVLRIDISENKAYDIATPVHLGFKFEHIANKGNIQRICHQIGAHDRVDPGLKQTYLARMGKLLSTLGDLTARAESAPKVQPCFTLCHGDLNPTNILVGPQNRVWLVDFDLLGGNLAVCDVLALVANLRLKIDFANLTAHFVKDAGQLEQTAFGVYAKHRLLDFETQFANQTQLGRALNLCSCAVFLSLNILDKGLIQWLPMGLMIMDKYLKVYDQLASKSE